MVQIIGKQYFLIVLIVAILSIPVSLILMPRTEEKAYMHFRDMDYENALTLYKKLWESGDRSHNVVTQLSQLYLQYGEVAKAIEIMEAYLAEHPDSYEAQEKISTLYQYNQQTDKYLQTLEILYKKRPTEQKLRDLSKLYNYYGKIDKQIVALEELIVAFSPTPQDYIDLAYLYGMRGNATKAQEILKKYLTSATELPSQEMLELYVNLLLDTNSRAEAAIAIQTYNQNPAFAAELALLLDSRGADTEAQQVLIPYLQEHTPHPKVLLALTEIEVNKDQMQPAFDRLVMLYHENKLPPKLLDHMVTLALKTHHDTLIADIVRSSDLRDLSEETILILIEHSLQISDPSIIKTLQKRLDSAFLNLYPIARDVLRLVSSENTNPTILALLSSGEVPLSEDALEALIGIYQRINHTDAAVQLLNRFVKEKNAGRDPLKVAEAYLDIGKPQEGFAAFTALHEKFPPTPAHTHAWALLAVASGKIKHISDINKETYTQSPTVLTDIYYVARDYHYAALALEAAQKLYAIKEDAHSRSLLASALVENQRYAEALEHLRILVSSGKFEADDYIAAVAGAAKSSKGILSEPLKADLRLLLDTILPKYPLAPIEMRNFAFLFYENRLHEAGDSFFVRLAENPKAHDINLEGLASYWSKRNVQSHLPWLWQRAKESEGKRQSLWLSLLLEAGETAEVARYIQSLPPEKTAGEEYKDMYYTALLKTKKIKSLEPILTSDIQQERGIRRLMDLASIAEDAELLSLTKHALTRVSIYLPHNPYINRKLGYIEYTLGDYGNSKKHIMASLATGEANYLTHYIAGELLTQSDDLEKADIHYKQALALLEKLPPKTTEQRSLQAELMLRANRQEEALVLYRTLHAKEPQNKELKADFANALIRLERYSEAEQLLEIENNKQRSPLSQIGKTVHKTYEDARKKLRRLWQEQQ